MVWASVGALFHKHRQTHDALSAYTNAISLEPQCAEVWFNTGLLYESTGQREDASEAYATETQASFNRKRHL